MGIAGKVERRRIVAVIGSGDEISEAQRRFPIAVGRWIAQAGHHLLTGGGPGVMEAACEGFCSVSREGVAIGIIPAAKPPDKYPNRWVELAIRTHLRGVDPRGPDSRNHINIRTADAVVAFTGRGGTRAELELTLARRPKCPLVACLRASETIGRLDRQTLEALGVTVEDTPEGVFRFLEAALR